MEYFHERFGVDDDVWAPYKLSIGQQSVHLTSGKIIDPEWSVLDRGFRIARKTTHSFKPTTRGIQWLQGRIGKSRIVVNKPQMEMLLRRKPVALEPAPDPSRGFVAVIFDGIEIGCGFWTGKQLETQISKAQSREFPIDV